MRDLWRPRAAMRRSGGGKREHVGAMRPISWRAQGAARGMMDLYTPASGVP
jgi:hypothetical protein